MRNRLSWPGLDNNRIGDTGTFVETFQKLHCSPSDGFALLVHTKKIHAGFFRNNHSHDMGFPAIYFANKTKVNSDQCSDVLYQGTQVAALVPRTFCVKTSLYSKEHRDLADCCITLRSPFYCTVIRPLPF